MDFTIILKIILGNETQSRQALLTLFLLWALWKSVKMSQNPTLCFTSHASAFSLDPLNAHLSPAQLIGLTTSIQRAVFGHLTCETFRLYTHVLLYQAHLLGLEFSLFAFFVFC